MAKNYVQEGKIMSWTNGTGGDIASGDVVLIGTRVGVALVDIADGESGSVAVAEVFEVPKVAPLAIAAGDFLYWDVADANFNKTATDNTLGGYAFADAASADTTVNIKLNG